MARSFNGTTDTAVASLSGLTGAQFGTFFWVNLKALGPIFLAVGNNSTNGYAFYTTVGGVLHFLAYGQADSATSATLSTNVWYHIGFNLDVSNNAYIYVNGSLVTGGSNPIAPSPYQILIPTTCNASLADIAHYKVFFASAIFPQVLVNSLAKGARPWQIDSGDLQGYWPMGGLQSPEPDLSGQQRNMTLTGTANASGPPVMQFTPRWPQFNFPPSAAPSFSPAWARSRNTIIEGVAT